MPAPPFLARLLGGGTAPPPPLPCPPHAAALTHAAAWGMLAAAVATFTALHCVPQAPYGRYGRTDPANAARYGRGVPARLAWFAQELPAFAVPLGMAVHAARATGGGWAGLATALGPQRTALLAAFLLHYAHRALVFPLRIRGGARTPVGIMAMALAFCAYNGAMQGASLLWCGGAGAGGAGSAPPALFRAGMAAWAAGAALNLAADAALRRLRRRRDAPAGSYAVPTGPLFTLVAAPNYSGEALEWAGWAAASGWAPPATAFAVFTLANLGPRARAHNAWYRRAFPGRFDGRAGLVPWVY